jgi:hypothetical protein
MPGSRIVVEPGDYREQLILKSNVTLTSRLPRGATIRLPAAATGSAVVAADVSSAEISGFRIVGDAATPLEVGIVVSASGVSIVDVEITGASRAGVSFVGSGSPSLVGSDIHDNPGTGLLIAANTAPRISHNVFSRNGMSEHAAGTFTIETGSEPIFRANVFLGTPSTVFVGMSEAARAAVLRDNWFLPLPDATSRPSSEAASRGRQ